MRVAGYRLGWPGIEKLERLGFSPRANFMPGVRPQTAILRMAVPAQLDDDSLTTDGVGTTMKNVGGGDTAGEVAVNVDVFGIKDFAMLAMEETETLPSLTLPSTAM